MEGFHHLDDRDVGTGVDELMVGLGRVGPAPGVGEGVELRLAGRPGRLVEEDVVVGVGVERRIEIDQVDAGIGELFGVPKPFEVVPEVEAFISRRLPI